MATARELIRFLRHRGFEEKRQTGSHLVLKHPRSGFRTVIPIHHGDIPKGLLHRILKDAGSSLDEFVRRERIR